MSVITQLSIFVNNEPGSFAAITAALKECGINLKAFNIAESSGFGVLRAIADNPQEACETLRKRNIVVKLTDVIAVPMEDKPGEIYNVAKVFGENNINIEYAYAYAIGSGGLFGKGLGESMQKLGFIPEAQNDKIFAFLGDPDGILIIAYVIIFVVLITLIVLMIRKKRKGDK